MGMMEQFGKYGFFRREYMKNHRNSTYHVMLLQDYNWRIPSVSRKGSKRKRRANSEVAGRKRNIARQRSR